MSTNHVSRNSNPIPPPPLSFNGGDGDDDDDQEMDTTLRLGPPGTTTTYKKSTTKLQGGDDDEDRVSYVSTNYSDDGIPSAVYNPTPLRWYCPPEAHFNGFDHNQMNTILITPNPLHIKKPREKKRKRKIRDEGGLPSVPFEEIPLLQQTLISREGTTPVFLYRKKLEHSDVSKDLHRLLVNETEKLMEFLREEEVAAVVGKGKGLKVVGIDGVGKVYEKVGVKEWSSLKKIAINSDWSQVVAANNAEKGDVVEIWGYREKDKACLAFNFRREREMEEDRLLLHVPPPLLMFV